MDKRMVAKHGFRLQKLEKPIMVRNVDGANNSGGAITHQVKANMYYKGRVERMRMDICNLGKTKMILEIPWLQAHNPEIDWETREVKMTKCPPLSGSVTNFIRPYLHQFFDDSHGLKLSLKPLGRTFD